jgi:hypothetical protein
MNIANTQNISKTLGLSYIGPDQKLPAMKSGQTLIVQNENQSNADSDYNFARKNLYDIIEAGQEALDEMMEFAKQSQSAGAYEVVGTLINGLVSANQKLLNLSKQVKEINKMDKADAAGESDGPTTVNNNLFVGNLTTAELHKLLKGE